MSIVKLKANGVEGFVSTENWANPNIYLMDFQVEKNTIDCHGEKYFAGDTFPKYREDLKYLGVEEF